MKETRYGLNEGMEVVEQIVASGQRQYVVEDAQGNTLFRIPLRGCMIDTRFRGGRLRFREMATGREGYVDTNGMVTFTAGAAGANKGCGARRRTDEAEHGYGESVSRVGRTFRQQVAP